MGEFEKYEAMKAAGSSPEAVWASAESEGLNQIVLFRMIREVYGLSLVEAKDVSVRARTGQSLEQHVDGLAAGLGRAVEE